MLAAFTLTTAACDSKGDAPVEPASGGLAEACVPSDSARANFRPAGEVARATNLAVYIDGSQSMAGFNNATTRELRPMGDLVALIQSRASDYENAAFYAFGREIGEISGDAASSYATPGPYNCSGCDNQESRLDQVLNAATKAGPDTVSVIITDLWLDNKSFAGSPQVALGRPLRAALQAGLSIGVIGIRAPFDGAVYDVPGVGTYRGASELPLYVLAIGPEEDISALQIALTQSGGPSFAASRMEYSLFSKESNNPFIPPQLRSIGAGASRALVSEHKALRGLPQYSIDLNVAEAQKGQLGRTVSFQTTLRNGLVWQGELAERTDAWRLASQNDLAQCGPGTWQRLSEIDGLWRPRDQDGKATFSFGHEVAAQLRPGNIYYLEPKFGSNEVGVPNVANQWMREWALDESNAQALVEAGTGPFKTLNLADLATILEQELSRQVPDGRTAIAFGFILKVER